MLLDSSVCDSRIGETTNVFLGMAYEDGEGQFSGVTHFSSSPIISSLLTQYI